MAFSAVHLGSSILLLAAAGSPIGAQQDSAAGRDRPVRITQTLPQSLLARPARLRARDVPLESALTLLDRSSGVSIVFSPSFLPESRRVSCACDAATVGEALERLLAGTQLRYKEIDGQIMIHRDRRAPDEPDPAPLSVPTGNILNVSADPNQPAPILALSRLVDAVQQAVVSGSVTDDHARPILGATVPLVGTAARTSTDAAGRFRLEVPRDPTVALRVTAIGYRPLTESVRVADGAIHLVLLEAAVNLDEIVVTGNPGDVQMRAVGNAVGRINAAELVATGPVGEVGQLLKGRAAGVLVRSGIGSLGTPPKINIRGSSSLTLNDKPLIYVDGVRVDNSFGNLQNWGGGGRLNDFNPDDIESIEIIKGPAASTLYGTEASSGVIQVITKRGSRGAPELNVQVKQGTMWMRDPEGRYPSVFFRDPAGAIQSLSPLSVSKAEGFNPYRTGWQQAYDLTVSGGTESTRYYISGEYGNNDGAERNNAEVRYGARATVAATLNPRVQLDGNLGYVRVETDTPTEGSFGGTQYALSTFTPSTLNAPTRG